MKRLVLLKNATISFLCFILSRADSVFCFPNVPTYCPVRRNIIISMQRAGDSRMDSDHDGREVKFVLSLYQLSHTAFKISSIEHILLFGTEISVSSIYNN